jgi:O-antigen/teichoic acid export membrane protein
MSFESKSAASRLKTVVVNSLANFAFPVTTLITGPLLARTLGPEGRGVMAALLAPITLANLMFTLGVPDALTYFVARGRLRGKQALHVAMGGGLICTIVACSALAIAAPYLFRAQTQLLPYFKPLLLTLPVTLGFSAIRGIAQGRQQFGLMNKEQIFGALLRLAVLSSFAAVHVLKPVMAVWASIMSGVVGSLFLLAALRRDEATRSSVEDAGTVARYAGSAALGTFGGLIMIRLDQVLMVSLTTRSELAYYSVAASLAELPLVVVSAIRDVAFSVTAQRDDPKIIARSCRLTVLAIGMLCVAGGVLTPLALPFLFGKKFAPAVWMVEVLLLGTMGRAVAAVIGAGLMTIGRTWLRSVIQLGGAAITAALLFMLVPNWGGLGAAWVTTVTYAALSFASMFAYVQSANLSFKQCLVPTASDFRDLKSAIGVNLRRAQQKYFSGI